MNCPICGMACEPGAPAPWHCPACKMYYDDREEDGCPNNDGGPHCSCVEEDFEHCCYCDGP